MSIYPPPQRQNGLMRWPDLKTQAQTFLTDPRYALADRTCGATKLAAVKTASAHKVAREAHHRKAAHVEKIAWTAAQKELTCLTETASTLCAGNDTLLTLFALPPQVSAPLLSPEPDGVADILAQWRATLAGVSQLDAPTHIQFALAGWPQTRINTACALVEGYSKAKQARQSALASAQAARKLYQAAVKDLETWYATLQPLPNP